MSIGIQKARLKDNSSLFYFLFLLPPDGFSALAERTGFENSPVQRPEGDSLENHKTPLITFLVCYRVGFHNEA
jgi:hypothetical protein